MFSSENCLNCDLLFLRRLVGRSEIERRCCLTLNGCGGSIPYVDFLSFTSVNMAM